MLCHAPDPSAFVSDVTRLFGEMKGFRAWQWTSGDRPVIATFQASFWDLEIFASALPVSLQHGWRHFEIEKRPLSVGDAGFKNAVKSLRKKGTKTEPAFWTALQQDGDAYIELLSSVSL
ncbi:DUF4269 domain-containing protein [Agrobacterium sp. FDAARGOS_525]|uniref:DUF4269 domain-containing protein n=1 Tax=Agrobacterium sp. FDAARGOS_525 TaxID=2420311 RepID=UPI00256E9CE1|nr:DUF4269 domain-containing protein [Agrobacterium sp. FDAARGOS_525]